MQAFIPDEKQSQELFDKALKYARLYAKDCEDLTAQELSDAVFEHLTKNKLEYLPKVDNIVKGVVNLIFRKKTAPEPSEISQTQDSEQSEQIENRPLPRGQDNNFERKPNSPHFKKPPVYTKKPRVHYSKAYPESSEEATKVSTAPSAPNSAEPINADVKVSEDRHIVASYPSKRRRR